MGGAVLAAGIGVYLLNLLISARRGAAAGANPWDAAGLEWATTSPPPTYNFGATPVVESREPLWQENGLAVMHGLDLDHREVLLTSVAEAHPDIREGSPKPSVWPFLTALTLSGLFIGSIFDEWFLVWASIPVTLCLLGWFWPKPSHSKMVGAPDDKIPGALA
jgi:cytochrome c oxidase subunit 1